MRMNLRTVAVSRPRLPSLRSLGWPGRVLLGLAGLLALVVIALAVFGWNWARGPLQELALAQTGRVLRIDGELSLASAWPLRVRAERVSLANPAWAQSPELLRADAVEARVDIGALLRGRLVLPELRLTQPQVFLEQSADGAGTLRKTWLFDKRQADDSAGVEIGQLLLDRGRLRYTDRAQDTAVQAVLTTEAPGAAAGEARALRFQLEGRLRGQALAAHGRGGAVLGWRDPTRPYPLQLSARIGSTQLEARGTITGLPRVAALDMAVEWRGDNLAALAPILQLPLPPTPAYRSAGRLVRDGSVWRYDSFTGQVGRSDVAGTLQLDTASRRPVLRGGLSSRQFDLADLGPTAGFSAAPEATAQPDRAATRRPRLLPDAPLDTRLWGRVDADVYFVALTLHRSRAQPLDRVQGRLRLDDRRLTLDPIAFGIADGQLQATLVLDARTDPLHAHAVLRLRGMPLQRLLPAREQGLPALGRLDGDAVLAGPGASLGRMLAHADGRVSLVVQNGTVSRLLMEQAGLHLLEILRLNITGDESVALRCAVADFDVQRGRMQVRTLVFDTAVSTVVGSGVVDLADETMALRFVPSTKVNSVIALRSPIYLRGSLAQPVVALDGAAVATRGLGALLLGLVNPLLALLPLFEAGPGADSPCAQLVREARTPAPRR